MKAAFNIPPSSGDKDELSLLIKVAPVDISFLWFTKSPFTVKGLATYNLGENDAAAEISNIMASLKNMWSEIITVTVCYDHKECLLVPEKYNGALISGHALALVYGNNQDAVINRDRITSADMYNYYRVPKEIAVLFSEHFPRATVFHSTSLQLELLNQEKDLLYCLMANSSLKVILYSKGKLQIVQQFNYSGPEDVAYYLLNICEQFAVKASEIPLRLSGMIDENSKLYTALYTYFLNVHLENTATEIYTGEEMNKLPKHFFSHLTALALCVS